MKQKKIIFAALLATLLLVLLGGSYSFYQVQRSKQRISDLTAQLQEKDNEVTTLKEELSQTKDSLAGQTDFVKELTEQVDALAGFAAEDSDTDDTEPETAKGVDGENTANASHTDSKKKDTAASDSNQKDASAPNYQEKYPKLYAQAEYEKREKEQEAEGNRKNGALDTEERNVYLTFDDGPSDLTPKVLDLLDEYDAKATFFVVYKDDEEYTKYLSDIVDRGHTLALHSYSHDYKKIYASVDAFLSDFQKVYDWVYEETGFRPTLFRFPGGSNNGTKAITDEIIAEMQRRGFIYYDWNVSSGDGSNLTTSDNIYENITTYVGSYDFPVVLMHDGPGKKATMNALPEVLKYLKNKGYSCCALDETMEPVQYQRSSRAKES